MNGCMYVLSHKWLQTRPGAVLKIGMKKSKWLYVRNSPQVVAKDAMVNSETFKHVFF
jgi:hypothetical protein